MSEIKYIAYIRVSTEKQGNSGLGMQAQRNIILNYVKEQDIAEWIEEKRSGKNLFVLPELERAKNLVRENEKYILIIAKADRFRNTRQALELIEKLGIDKVWFCNIGRHADKFTLTLFFAFAEKERLEISVRTKAALAVLKARGVKLGRPWHKEKNLEKIRKAGLLGAQARKRQAIADPRNMNAYVISVELRKTGETYAKITEKLNSGGFTTPRGKRWRASSVYRNTKRYETK